MGFILQSSTGVGSWNEKGPARLSGLPGLVQAPWGFCLRCLSTAPLRHLARESEDEAFLSVPVSEGIWHMYD